MIEINGEVVVKPEEFNKNVDVIVKTISLKSQNEIAVEVRSEPGSYIIVSIFGPDAPPSNLIESIKVDPQEIFIDEQKYVKINAKVKEEILQYSPILKIQRVDKYGNLLSEEGNLYDDGNMENGDEAAGDGIYSLRKIFLSDIEQMIYLRICINYNSITSYSEKFNLYFLKNLTDEDLDEIKDIQSYALQEYKNLASQIGVDAAINQVISYLEQNPYILQVGRSDDNGYGIWILYSSGVLGSIDLTPEDLESYQNNYLYNIKENSAKFENNSESSYQRIVRIGNNKAIVLSPFHYEFGIHDPCPDIKEILENSYCSKFDVTSLKDSQVTVDVIKNLYQYGIIFINTHGNTYFKFLNFEIWGWIFYGAQVVFCTGEEVTKQNKIKYEVDLKMGRLVLSTTGLGITVYGIMPSFIKHYSINRFPKSLVFIASCRSYYYTSLVDAFIGVGAGNYLAYVGYIKYQFVKESAFDFFDEYFNGVFGVTAYKAFIETYPKYSLGIYDPVPLAKPVTAEEIGIKNGSFEMGFENWQKDCDNGTNIINSFGEFGPLDGSYMAKISLGSIYYSKNRAYIEQEIMCLPPEIKEIEFYYNFISEEFKEWCEVYDPLRDDEFSITIYYKYQNPYFPIKSGLIDFC
ncbi:MAG: hypothetical protein WH035_06230, partial [Spirochaetota bacterium]